jgi:hypothetical protein
MESLASTFLMPEASTIAFSPWTEHIRGSFSPAKVGVAGKESLCLETGLQKSPSLINEQETQRADHKEALACVS